MSDQARHTLRIVVRRLRALSDPASDDCGVPPAAREAARLYVTTWLLPLVEDVLDAEDARLEKIDRVRASARNRRRLTERGAETEAALALQRPPAAGGAA